MTTYPRPLGYYGNNDNEPNAPRPETDLFLAGTADCAAGGSVVGVRLLVPAPGPLARPAGGRRTRAGHGRRFTAKNLGSTYGFEGAPGFATSRLSSGSSGRIVVS